jgi:hypothetical protein
VDGEVNEVTSMKRNVTLAVAGLLVAAVSVASAQGAFERPGMLTSIGQSSDIAIVKVVLNTQLKLGLDVKPLALATDVAGVKTLVMVVGASTKGLGAAGLDVDKEVARAKALLKAAKDNGIKVLVVHTGGEARRGKTSNDMINAVVPDADCAVVVAAGNKDKLFNTLSAGRKTPVIEVDKMSGVAEAVRPLFK